MTTVKRVSQAIKTVQVAEEKKYSIKTMRQPTTLADMADTSFGDLDSTKDGYFVQYNNTTKLFDLVSADQLLETAVEDNDLPDTFISQVEAEIDLGAIDEDVDGGTF